MKIGQFIEYHMRNIFLKQSYMKYGGEASPRPFSKEPKLSNLYSLFLLHVKAEIWKRDFEGYQNISKLKS